MVHIENIQQLPEPDGVLQQAVEFLRCGRLVVLPDETGYGLAGCAANNVAISVMSLLPASTNDRQTVLMLERAEVVADLISRLSIQSQRLIRRCWPGPVILIVSAASVELADNSVPTSAVDLAQRDGGVCLQVPAASTMRTILREINGPLIFSEAAREAALAEDFGALAGKQFHDAAALIIENGPPRFDSPASIVDVRGDVPVVTREGIVTQRMVTHMSGVSFLFVCTGNTCRSPMAEGLFRRMVADHVACGEAELHDRGFEISSAGLAATWGGAASRESVEALSRRGIRIYDHQSQPLTARLLDHADYVFTMTRRHREAILNSRPDLADRIQMLSPDGMDIADPIGGGPDDYEMCARQIESCLREVMVQTIPKDNESSEQ